MNVASQGLLSKACAACSVTTASAWCVKTILDPRRKRRCCSWIESNTRSPGTTLEQARKGSPTSGPLPSLVDNLIDVTKWNRPDVTTPVLAHRIASEPTGELNTISASKERWMGIPLVRVSAMRKCVRVAGTIDPVGPQCWTYILQLGLGPGPGRNPQPLPRTIGAGKLRSHRANRFR